MANSRTKGARCRPASAIIAKLGGISVVAEVTGTSESQVYRWQREKHLGGLGGTIPHWHHVKLLAKAKELGVPMFISDFYPSDEQATEAAAAA